MRQGYGKETKGTARKGKENERKGKEHERTGKEREQEKNGNEEERNEKKKERTGRGKKGKRDKNKKYKGTLMKQNSKYEPKKKLRVASWINFGLFLVPGAALGTPGEPPGPWGRKWSLPVKLLGTHRVAFWRPLAAIGSPLGSLGAPWGDLLAPFFKKKKI